MAVHREAVIEAVNQARGTDIRNEPEDDKGINTNGQNFRRFRLGTNTSKTTKEISCNLSVFCVRGAEASSSHH